MKNVLKSLLNESMDLNFRKKSLSGKVKLYFPNLTQALNLSKTWHIYWCNELTPISRFNLNFWIILAFFGDKSSVFFDPKLFIRKLFSKKIDSNDFKFLCHFKHECSAKWAVDGAVKYMYIHHKSGNNVTKVTPQS